MNISTKIKNRRKDLGFTMLQLANKVGVSEATISRWESGDIANMRRDKIVSLATALSVPPSYIMDYEDKQSPDSSAYKFLPTSDTEQYVLSSFRKLTPEDQKYIVKTIDILVDRYPQDAYIAALGGHISVPGSDETPESARKIIDETFNDG